MRTVDEKRAEAKEEVKKLVKEI
jgi:hypothetical protein